MNIIFVLDPTNYNYIKETNSFNLPLSHDKYSLSMSLAIKEQADCKIYYHSPDHKNELLELEESIYNLSKISLTVEDVLDYHSFLFVICPTQLIPFRDRQCKKICLIAAIHWLESPLLHDGSYHHDYLIAIRDIVDIVVTQTMKMKNILNWYSKVIACSDMNDRIIVCPTPIKHMNIFVSNRVAYESELLNKKITEHWIDTGKNILVCSGGIWNWTNYIEFLRAYIKLCRLDGPHTLRLLITGFAPPDLGNYHEHASTINEVKRLLDYNKDIVSDLSDINGSHYIGVVNDWSEAGMLLKSVIGKAFLGLSLNKATIESWQSFRQRTTDYIMANLPFLHTGAGSNEGITLENGVILSSPTSSDIYNTLKWILLNLDKVRAISPKNLLIENDTISSRGIEELLSIPKREFHSTWLGKSILEVHRDNTFLPVIHKAFHP